MKAIFNTITNKLIITDPKIKNFEEIVKPNDKQLYWNCLHDKITNKAIYDINLFLDDTNPYNSKLILIPLIDTDEGEIIVTDESELINLIIT